MRNDNVPQRRTNVNPKRSSAVRRAARAVASVLCEPIERRTLMSAGALDTSFGGDGIVDTTPYATANAQADAVAVQSNGDIVVAGVQSAITGNQGLPAYTGSTATLVVRYLPDGELDPSFGANGIVRLDDGLFEA